MDDKSYNELRAELLYDEVIEGLLSLILSQLFLRYSEVEEKKWKRIPKQLIQLKELRPSLFLEDITPELNSYNFSKEKVYQENKKEVSKKWKFLAPLNMSGDTFYKTKSGSTNKNRTVDASPLVLGSKKSSFKIFLDFFDPVTFAPLDEKRAKTLVDWQREDRERSKQRFDRSSNHPTETITAQSFVKVNDDYYICCANQELLKVRRLVKTISKDRILLSKLSSLSYVRWFSHFC